MASGHYAGLTPMDNHWIAEHLREHARQRDAAGGNLLRVRAYRRAAHLIEEMAEPITGIFERAGRRGLGDLPGVGRRIAAEIERIILASRAA